jgi:hypothetical protein
MIAAEAEFLRLAINEAGQAVDPHIVGRKRVTLRVACVRRLLAAARELAAQASAGPPVSLARTTVSDVPPAVTGNPWSARNTPATAEAYRLRHNDRVASRPLAERPALASAVLGDPGACQCHACSVERAS